MKYRVKGWDDFQHYKDRNPPWIRLHKRLLDSFDFHCLQDASRALAPMLWLLASEHKEPLSGLIDLSDEQIAFRIRRPVEYLQQAIKPLIDGGFIEVVQDDSNMLAPCKQLAVPETETETETETEEKPDSAKAALWSLCRAYLGEKKMSLVGKWVKDHGEAKVYELVLDAQKREVADPVSYITKALIPVPFNMRPENRMPSPAGG